MGRQNHSQIQDALLRWFDRNQRDLPWRRGYSPYTVWIAEIMLQQTQVQTMLPYFNRWMERFPGIRSVARASQDLLLKYWEGLGYYARARNIHRTAQILTRDYAGEFPREHHTLCTLPGIGRYTAGAIMSLAFNADYPVVDGNVERVFSRLFDIRKPVKDKESQRFIWRTAEELIPEGRARHFNQALMELGATLCVPRNPDCRQCPISVSCASHDRDIVHQRPVRQRRPATVPMEAVVGILTQNRKIFIQKRPDSGLMPNLWEFPGGKIDPGETPEQALVREFHEELGLRIRCLERIAVIRHSYTNFRVRLHAYFCELLDSNQVPVLRAAAKALWVTRQELQGYAFPAANRKLIKLL